MHLRSLALTHLAKDILYFLLGEGSRAYRVWAYRLPLGKLGALGMCHLLVYTQWLLPNGKSEVAYSTFSQGPSHLLFYHSLKTYTQTVNYELGTNYICILVYLPVTCLCAHVLILKYYLQKTLLLICCH